jgi:predicted RNA-binding protein
MPGSEDNIKVDITEPMCEDVESIRVSQNKVQLWDLVNVIRTLRFTDAAGNSLAS